MPRGPRLDAPGTFHHVMVRGLERRAVFRDAQDRAAFLARLAAIVEREVLGQFHRTVGEARRRSRQFVAEGAPQGRRPELQGGGLRGSLGRPAGGSARGQPAAPRGPHPRRREPPGGRPPGPPGRRRGQGRGRHPRRGAARRPARPGAPGTPPGRRGSPGGRDQAESIISTLRPVARVPLPDVARWGARRRRVQGCGIRQFGRPAPRRDRWLS